MNTTNNTKNKSALTPWTDWKLDAEFLSEINKYCDNHNTKFSDIVEDIIKGICKLEVILVRYRSKSDTLFSRCSWTLRDNSPMLLIPCCCIQRM